MRTIARCNVRAPFSGVVTQRLRNAGEVHEASGDNVAVRGALQSGDRVAVIGAEALDDGELVAVRSET